MKNLSIYRMYNYNDIEALISKVGKGKLSLYIQQIYTDLIHLKNGCFYPIEKTWLNIDIELRVKICCLFISEQANGEYSMNELYTIIIRN